MMNLFLCPLRLRSFPLALLEGEKNDHQRQETVTEKQRLEPASRSGGKATAHSRGLGCSTQREKLL